DDLQRGKLELRLDGIDHTQAQIHRIANRLLVLIEIGERHRRVAHAERDLAGILDALQHARELLGLGHVCEDDRCDGEHRLHDGGFHWPSSVEMVSPSSSDSRRTSEIALSIARASRATISSRSGSRTMNGGARSTWSPRWPSIVPPIGYTHRPSRIAAALTRACRRSAGSNGALVARSATSSTPRNNPRPRRSPTCACCPNAS